MNFTLKAGLFYVEGSAFGKYASDNEINYMRIMDVFVILGQQTSSISGCGFIHRVEIGPIFQHGLHMLDPDDFALAD